MTPSSLFNRLTPAMYWH